MPPKAPQHRNIATSTASGGEVPDCFVRRILQLEGILETTNATLGEEKKENIYLRQRTENLSMYLEDLEGVNQRQHDRKKDLLHAYWPVMKKYKDLEIERDLLKGGVVPAAHWQNTPCQYK